MISREEAAELVRLWEGSPCPVPWMAYARTVVALHDEVERLRAEIAKLPATVDQTVNLLRLAEASVSLLRADIADRERERERLQNMIWAANGVLSDNGCDCDCEHHWEEHEPDCERCLACRIDNAMRAAVPGSV